jgi:uncharacterized protein YqcC (DUF446 family)
MTHGRLTTLPRRFASPSGPPVIEPTLIDSHHLFGRDIILPAHRIPPVPSPFLGPYMAGKHPNDDDFEEDDDDVEEDDEGDDENDAEDSALAPAEPESTDEVDDTPPPLSAAELNAKLFTSAVASLREVIPSWKMQADLLLGHSVDFVPDFDSLEGRYDWVGPFVNLAIAGTLDALAKVRFDPVYGPGTIGVTAIRIVPIPPGSNRCAAELVDSALTVWISLDGDVRPTRAIADAMCGAIGTDRPVTPPAMVDPFAPVEDPYDRAAAEMQRLEKAMRSAGVWPKEPPPDPLIVQGAFGAVNMTFNRWLAWVFVPRVRDVITSRAAFPKNSSVGAYAAMRGFAEQANVGEVIKVLKEFDRFLGGQPR